MVVFFVNADNIKLVEGLFKVYKMIDGEEVVFGLFDDLKTAIKHRDYYRRYDWDIDLKGVKDPEYLEGEIILENNDDVAESNVKMPMYVYRTNDDTFKIFKTLEGKKYCFGEYFTMESAIQARDYFKGTDWKLDDAELFNEVEKTYWDTNELF